MRWQYMVSNLTGDGMPNLADLLNAAGEEGWELVSVVDPPESRHVRSLIFKRPESAA